MGASRRVVVLLALAAVPTVAACQLVLGLDEFTTSDAGGGLETGAPDGGDAGDASVLPDAFTKKVDWAEWRMPNPTFVPKRPQDAGPTDANYNVATFVKLTTLKTDAGTFDLYTDRDGKDAGTPLRWLIPTASSSTMTEADAETFCAALGAHVPSRIELVTLLSFATNGAVRLMPGLEASKLGENRYWSSSPVRPYVQNEPVKFWTVSFSGTDSAPVAPKTGTDALQVVCAEGPAK